MPGNRSRRSRRRSNLLFFPNVPQRAQMEEELPMIKIMSARAATEVQRLQVEESGIVQELATEQGRWTDINQRMEELERALGKK